MCKSMTVSEEFRKVSQSEEQMLEHWEYSFSPQIMCRVKSEVQNFWISLLHSVKLFQLSVLQNNWSDCLVFTQGLKIVME